MTNQINDRGLEAAAKELFKAKYGWQPAVHAPGDNLKAMTADIIQAYLPFHQPANQEDCRTDFERWFLQNYGNLKDDRRYLSTQYAADMFRAWQAAYQSRREVVGDGEIKELIKKLSNEYFNLGFARAINRYPHDHAENISKLEDRLRVIFKSSERG